MARKQVSPPRHDALVSILSIIYNYSYTILLQNRLQYLLYPPVKLVKAVQAILLLVVDWSGELVMLRLSSTRSIMALNGGHGQCAWLLSKEEVVIPRHMVASLVWNCTSLRRITPPYRFPMFLND